MGWDPAVVPDPQDPETFLRSKLDWSEPDVRPARANPVACTARLARLRRTHPDLTDPRFDRVDCTADEVTRLFRMRRGALEIVVNFGDSPQTVPLRDATHLLFATGDDVLVNRASLTLPRHAGALLR